MKRRTRHAAMLAACTVVAGVWAGARWIVAGGGAGEATPRSLPGGPTRGRGPYPSDWFGVQRAFPGPAIPQERYLAALQQNRLDRALQAAKPDAPAATQPWVQAGPFNIGGRVTALAVVPGGATIYLGSANGGVFKSTNGGVGWTPVSDELAAFSIGALALEPGDPDVVYLGTGEANSSVDSYDGAGLFRSENGGDTWDYVGLEATRRIARVAVDPSNPDRLFVAALGTQFSSGPHRGLYRSENRGQSWSKVLFVNDSTGACDVVVNPAHPETVFAATFERIRRPTYRRAYGPGSGIWRSTDAGTTWTRLLNGLPAPSDSVGRIALGLAASRPSTLYAQIGSGANLGYVGLGLYRSLDGGDTWTRRDIGTTFRNSFGGFCWYFGDLGVDPTNPDRIWILGVTLRRSTDAGLSWTNITSNAHVDMHALWIDPGNPSRLYLGNDGGFYSTATGGGPWFKSVDLPISQFYAGTIDPQHPQRLLGGTQDNSTLITSGPVGGWRTAVGGDGFYCAVDPTDSSIVFAEYQYGSGGVGPLRSVDGGTLFAAPTGFVGADRYNWCMPFVISPTNHQVLLAGSQRVYKSTDNGQSYAPVSPDLSTDPPASLVYGTITTLDISPVDATRYWAGTDDGQVWRGDGAGSSWTNVSAGLPPRWVTRVSADPFAAQVVYVTLSGFGLDEHAAHVYRSPDAGATWVPIDGDLPDVPVNDVLVDPADGATLYAGTDVGVYATRNGGAHWFPLGSGMPVQAVFDLTLHHGSRTLAAATNGRSMWKLDVAQLPTAVAAEAGGFELRLGAPQPNPSRGAVRFGLETAVGGTAEVSVYDVGGRRVRLVRRAGLGAGRHALGWDGRDDAGRPAAAGVYFVRAAVGGAVRVQRLVRVE